MKSKIKDSLVKELLEQAVLYIVKKLQEFISKTVDMYERQKKMQEDIREINEKLSKIIEILENKNK